MIISNLGLRGPELSQARLARMRGVRQNSVYGRLKRTLKQLSEDPILMAT